MGQSEDVMATLIRSGTDRVTVTIASMSAAALLLSALSLLLAFDDDLDRRQVEERLACLELPGPNDCGLDSR